MALAISPVRAGVTVCCCVAAKAFRTTRARASPAARPGHRDRALLGKRVSAHCRACETRCRFGWDATTAGRECNPSHTVAYGLRAGGAGCMTAQRGSRSRRGSDCVIECDRRKITPGSHESNDRPRQRGPTFPAGSRNSGRGRRESARAVEGLGLQARSMLQDFEFGRLPALLRLTC